METMHPQQLGANCISAPQQHVSEIQALASELDYAMDAIIASLQLMEGRITPILSGEAPLCAIEQPDASCQISEWIAKKVLVARSINRDIGCILGRIQL